MRKLPIGFATILTVLIGLSGLTLAQSLPIPDAPVATDIAGAHELPDPSVTYKVVFSIKNPASKPDAVNPGLITVARYFNTLAKYGVPADHRKIAVVFNGAEVFLTNAAYKERNGGHDNPNIPLIQSMKKAGIEFHVCGQELLGRKIDPTTVLPEVQVDLWAMTTITNLEARGYTFIGGH
jgi:intracellular sulfur oxidation DsrE/DsrF family protein